MGLNKCEVRVGLGIVGIVVGSVLIYRWRKNRVVAPPPPPPESFDPAFALSVADALAKTKGLKPDADDAQGAFDRSTYFFVHRRALDLGRADPSKRSGAGLLALQHRLEREVDLVRDFLTSLVGTAAARGPYFGGPGGLRGEAAHLDLGQFVSPRTSDLDSVPTNEALAVKTQNPTGAMKRTLDALDRRRAQVITIVWRAAAIESTLWSKADSAPELKIVSLTTLLDRRLRSIERLRFQASAGVNGQGIGSTFVDRVFSQDNSRSNTHGPWLDGFQLRPFEAPSIARTAKNATKRFENDDDWRIEDIIGHTGTLVQRLKIDGSPTGGTFQLSYNGDRSDPISFDANDRQITDAFQPVLSDASLSLSVFLNVSGGVSFRMNIQGLLNRPDERIEVEANNLTGGISPRPVLDAGEISFDLVTDESLRFLPTRNPFPWYLNHATDEYDRNIWPGTRMTGQWSLCASDTELGYAWVLVPQRGTQVLQIGGVALGGSFTLKLDGNETPSISFDASGRQVQAALAKLPSAGDDFLCLGGPLPRTPVTIVFKKDSRTSELVEGTNHLSGPLTPKPHLSPKTVPSDPSSRVIHDLFEPVTTGLPALDRKDWFARAWLHSDGVMSALHLEALRHGLLRQHDADQDPDVEFNALADHFTLALDDYFRVRTVTHADTTLMEPGRNDYFENGTIAFDDLQIGDQVLFDTNPALAAAGFTAWDYPTVLVTGIDTARGSPPGAPRITLSGVSVQGFNTPDESYAQFQELLVANANRGLQGLRDFIAAEIDRERARAAAAGTPFVPPTGMQWDIGILTEAQATSSSQFVLRLWNPYADTFNDPGPWWIWIHLMGVMWKDVFGTNVDATMRRIPGGVTWLQDETKVYFPNTGAKVATASGFHEPPWQDELIRNGDSPNVIFVPLFQPVGGWQAYFERKASASPPAQGPQTLEPVSTDAKWFAGFAPNPTDASRIRVIRPLPKVAVP